MTFMLLFLVIHMILRVKSTEGGDCSNKESTQSTSHTEVVDVESTPFKVIIHLLKNLKEDVMDLKEDLKDLKEDVMDLNSTVQKDLKDLKQDLKDLKEDVMDLNSTVQKDLKEDLKDLKENARILSGKVAISRLKETSSRFILAKRTNCCGCFVSTNLRVRGVNVAVEGIVTAAHCVIDKKRHCIRSIDGVEMLNGDNVTMNGDIYITTDFWNDNKSLKDIAVVALNVTPTVSPLVPLDVFPSLFQQLYGLAFREDAVAMKGMIVSASGNSFASNLGSVPARSGYCSLGSDGNIYGINKGRALVEEIGEYDDDTRDDSISRKALQKVGDSIKDYVSIVTSSPRSRLIPSAFLSTEEFLEVSRFACP